MVRRQLGAASYAGDLYQLVPNPDPGFFYSLRVFGTTGSPANSPAAPRMSQELSRQLWAYGEVNFLYLLLLTLVEVGAVLHKPH